MIFRKATTLSPTLPALPKNWSELTWQQLSDCWQVKVRYGGNADVARMAALLKILPTLSCNRQGQAVGTKGWRVERSGINPATGEQQYTLRHRMGSGWIFTSREAAHIAKTAMSWFDFPYGDPGEDAVKDEKGKVVKERREPVRGYVNAAWRDAMALPLEELKIWGRCFALPQVAMYNLTWAQYRSLQALAPQCFREDIPDGDALSLQAQFLANSLTPRSLALLDTSGGSTRFRLHWDFRYNARQADGLARWWERKLKARSARTNPIASVLFHICFQCYQTAVQYYETIYPILFQRSANGDPLRDALAGEAGTINSVMKYAGYAEQQQVYDSDLPFVLDILNTMTKEAKEIEKMNSRVKRKG